MTPDDAERIRTGITELSPRSRYYRFFSAINELTAEQLRYLSTPDQASHVAWCALDPGTPDLHGLGLGRMVRHEEAPESAEFAVVVVDAYQHQGIGTLLTAILCAAALERGIRTLDALVLPDNREVLDWFARLGARIVDLGDCHEARIDLATFVDGATRFRGLVAAVRPAVRELCP